MIFVVVDQTARTALEPPNPALRLRFVAPPWRELTGLVGLIEFAPPIAMMDALSIKQPSCPGQRHRANCPGSYTEEWGERGSRLYEAFANTWTLIGNNSGGRCRNVGRDEKRLWRDIEAECGGGMEMRGF
ncbi:hypothetical protein V2G26_011628 [Clonostachys chloroleuca]